MTGQQRALDLDAYLARIGYGGPRAASLEVLAELHRLHPAAIPFENLDPFLGRPVPLDPASVAAKLVGERRGGYCFEQNLLLRQALSALGFSVRGLAARVLWGYPRDAVTPRSHMLLAVEIDGGTWLADVGFGGLTQTAPLALAPGREQATPHEPFRVAAVDGHYLSQARVGGEWRTLYRFDLQEQHDVDYAITNYYLSTHPKSHFRATLLAARAIEGARYALLGNRLTIRETGGKTEQRVLPDGAATRDALATLFGVEAPQAARFDERFAETVAGQAG